MAYKTDLQSNNTDLQSILDMILALGLVDKPKPCLKFKSDRTFTMSVKSRGWNGKMYYSLDENNWNEWNGSEISGNTIYVRGKGNTKVTGSTSTNYAWHIDGREVYCTGNIESLLDYEVVFANEHPTMTTYCYAYMFYDCASLVTPPSLPATTLSDYCYNGMFNGCYNLTTAPDLPATTLTTGCYRSMFSGCSDIDFTTAPSLPATTLAQECYKYMFSSCLGLTTAPSLPATTLANGCYYGMFDNCTSLTTVPSLPATTLAQECYNGMFNSCRSIKLSATQTSEYTKAYRIPTSGTGTVGTNSLYDMFSYTGGTFKGTPSINTTYYLHSSNTIV